MVRNGGDNGGSGNNGTGQPSTELPSPTQQQENVTAASTPITELNSESSVKIENFKNGIIYANEIETFKRFIKTFIKTLKWHSLKVYFYEMLRPVKV